MNSTKETKLIETNANLTELKTIIKDISCNQQVLSLKKQYQHPGTSRYTHCLNVAIYTYIICKKLGLDYISAARGAMLHDFYFYDWRAKEREGPKLHAFKHPRVALNNATDIFELNDIEKDVILKHMWPLTVILPKYKESYIITLVDKYCATLEIIKYFKQKIKKRR